jgi:hypothetical protein
MANRSDLLLQVLHAGGAADHALAAEQVNGLSAVLGVPEQDLCQLVGELQDEGLISVRWGGEVRLTQKGRARASGKDQGQGAISVGNIGAGANVNIGSPGAVAGTGAMRIEVPSLELAARSVAALRELGPALVGPQQDKAKALADGVEDALKSAQNPQADPEPLKGKLARVKGLVGDLSEIAEKGGRLWSALSGVTAVLGPVARAFGIPWVL